MKTLIRISVLVLALLITGCYRQEKIYHIQGKNFDIAKVDDIQIGSSRDEVLDVLGKPNAEYEVDDKTNTVDMVYYYERNRYRKQTIFGRETAQYENMIHKEVKIRMVNGNVRQIDTEKNSTLQ